MNATFDTANNTWRARLIARVGDSLEVLDGIREALAGQDKSQILELVNGYIDRARADLKEAHAGVESMEKAIRVEAPSDLDPADFYEEYFAWLMEHEATHKDGYIAFYEAGHRFDEFISSKHPELMVVSGDQAE